MPAHELGERVGGVLGAAVPGQQVVQVPHHLGEPLLRGRIGGRPHRVAQPGEPLTEHVVAEPVEDLLVRPAGVLAGPLVAGQLLHRPRGGAGQVVQDRLGEPRAVVVAAPQLVPLGGEGLVEQGLGPGHRAVQVAPAQRLPAQPPRPGGQVVQAATALRDHGAAGRAGRPAGCRRPAPRRRPRRPPRARRTAGASGSGPPCHCPYRNRLPATVSPGRRRRCAPSR